MKNVGNGQTKHKKGNIKCHGMMLRFFFIFCIIWWWFRHFFLKVSHIWWEELFICKYIWMKKKLENGASDDYIVTLTYYELV